MWIEPNNPTNWEIIGKVVLWLIIGVIIWIFILVVLILLWGMFDQAITNYANGNTMTTNPILPLVLIWITFICTFIWNIIVAWCYNLFFSSKYYDMSKMFKFTITSNFLLFFMFIPLYIVFYDNILLAFVILCFHILFSVFISYNCIEFITNPNYAASNLIWSTIWFSLSLLIILWIYKSQTWEINKNILLMWPTILAYTFVPLFHSIWEKIYYKFYENWNNFFYIPSIDEVLVEEEEYEDESNVEQ